MLNSKEKKSNFFENYIMLIPIMFAIAVIPNIVRITYYDPQLADYSWFSSETWVMDMFMYYKNQAMMLLDGVLVLGFIYLAVKKKLSAQMSFLPLLVYFIMVVFSTIASVAPAQTWGGFYGMMESAYAVFGYCMICYYTYLVVKNEKQLKILGIVFLLGVTVLCAIGISQFLGHDFFMSDIGRDFIFPKKYAGYKEMLSATFGAGRVYSTLYNPNYVGAYASMLIPVFMILAFTSKKKFYTGLYIVFLSMILVCMTGARSKTAVLVLIPCMVVMLIYFGKYYWKKMLLIYLICIIEFIAFNIYQGENSLWSNTLGVLLSEIIPKSEQRLKDITLNDENYTITYDDEVLTVRHINEEDFWKIEAVDSDGKVLETSVNETENGYILNDERFDGLEFVLEVDEMRNVGFSLKFKSKSYFIFYSESDQTYYYMNYYGRATKMYSSDTYESFVFRLFGGFTKRGFIWGKSIPLLKETLILGSGPDTFAFMFPQYDYVDLLLNGWDKILITKPHSLFLQTGVQTGVISLIAFLMFNLCYCIQSVKLYFKRKFETFTECCGAAIFVGVVCFILAGMTTDSTIGVSVIYWALLGMGFACNQIISRNDENLQIN